MKETDNYIFFLGGIYSQWYKSIFIIDSIKFSSCEQWMMWSKAMLFMDLELAKQILGTEDPKLQKQLGRKVKGFNQNIWDKNKRQIIVKGNFAKFSQNEKLKQELLSNNKILVEGSPYDCIYGVGLKWDDSRILDEKNWKGENLLGKALMEVRSLLKE